MSACGKSEGFAAHGMYGLPFDSHSLTTGRALFPSFVGVLLHQLVETIGFRRNSFADLGILSLCLPANVQCDSSQKREY